MNVLIIDDEQFIAELVKDWLEERGYGVKLAYSGGDGRRAIAEARPDVILLDAVLPDMKGIDLLREIRENPDTKYIKIIMISADDTVSQAIKYGADDFIIKPLSINKLIEKLNLK